MEHVNGKLRRTLQRQIGHSSFSVSHLSQHACTIPVPACPLNRAMRLSVPICSYSANGANSFRTLMHLSNPVINRETGFPEPKKRDKQTVYSLQILKIINPGYPWHVFGLHAYGGFWPSLAVIYVPLSRDALWHIHCSGMLAKTCKNPKAETWY